MVFEMFPNSFTELLFKCMRVTEFSQTFWAIIKQHAEHTNKHIWRTMRCTYTQMPNKTPLNAYKHNATWNSNAENIEIQTTYWTMNGIQISLPNETSLMKNMEEVLPVIRNNNNIASWRNLALWNKLGCHHPHQTVLSSSLSLSSSLLMLLENDFRVFEEKNNRKKRQIRWKNANKKQCMCRLLFQY